MGETPALDRFIAENWDRLSEPSRRLLTHTMECPTCSKSTGPAGLCADGALLFADTTEKR